jgi:enoyl-CoA hydratase/carnithine racemase
MTSEPGRIGVERRGGICTLTLDRPAKKNSLTLAMVDEMTRLLAALAQEVLPPVLVIQGAGAGAFCSGFDIGSLPADAEPAAGLERISPVEGLLQGLLAYPLPAIARIDGAAFGAGCELAVCCDIRVGSERTSAGMPPARLGLVYPWTGLRRFVQTIGLAAAREVFFTGRTYRGERLRELGLVDYLLAQADVEPFTRALAEDIASNAPLALRGIKTILNALMHAVDLRPADRQRADRLVAEALTSEDLREGRLAFMEKRRPRFKGR